MKESLLQTKVMRYLHANKIYARKIHDSYTAGLPDITCVIDGRAIFIELKSDKGYLSKIQILEKEKIERAGGKFYVVRSMDELKRILGEI